MKNLINTYRDRFIPVIEHDMFKFFNTLMPEEYKEQKEIIRYHFGWDENSFSQESTGKRLRPLILLLATEGVGGKWESAIPGAVAVEFIHNFSLIHDDIEDHDEFRHGRPTVWKKWGVEKAINAGDAIFSLAFLVMGKLEDESVKFQEIYTLLSQTCAKLTGGQSMDISFEKESIVTKDDYLLMVAGKTASLFSACAEIGAILGGGNIQERENIARFGQKLGMAYQIHDDWLGLWGKSKLTGKTKANDLVAGKKTFPIIYALDKKPDLSKKIERKADQNIDEVIQEIAQTGAKEYTKEYEDILIASALDDLQHFEKSNRPIQALSELIQTLCNRKY